MDLSRLQAASSNMSCSSLEQGDDRVKGAVTGTV